MMRRTAAARRGLLAIGVLVCAVAVTAGLAAARGSSDQRVYHASLSVKAVWRSTLQRTETLSADCKAEVQADATRILTVRSTRPVTVVFRHGRIVGMPLLRVSGVDATGGSNMREETCGGQTSVLHADCVPLKRRFGHETLRLQSRRALDVTPQRFSYRPFDPEGDCFLEPEAARERQPGLQRIHVKVPAKELANAATARIVVRGSATTTTTQLKSRVDETLTWTLTLIRST